MILVASYPNSFHDVTWQRVLIDMNLSDDKSTLTITIREVPICNNNLKPTELLVSLNKS